MSGRANRSPLAGDSGNKLDARGVRMESRIASPSLAATLLPGVTVGGTANASARAIGDPEAGWWRILKRLRDPELFLGAGPSPTT